MYKCLFALIFFKLFWAQSAFAVDLQELVHLSDETVMNSKIFTDDGFWKEKTQESFWNTLILFKQQGKTYCLLYRYLKTRTKDKEAMLLVEKKLGLNCIDGVDKPFWDSGEVDQVKIERGDKEFFLSFVKGSQFQQYQFKWLTQIYQPSGIQIIKSIPPAEEHDFSSPCLQLDKNCKPVLKNSCHRCPHGVVGFYDKNNCAGQSLYCRKDKECGVSEKEACQVSLEASLGCEDRKLAYFCRENLNMVCEKGRLVCY
jgi:hypothetical protein